MTELEYWTLTVEDIKDARDGSYTRSKLNWDEVFIPQWMLVELLKEFKDIKTFEEHYLKLYGTKCTIIVCEDITTD